MLLAWQVLSGFEDESPQAENVTADSRREQTVSATLVIRKLQIRLLRDVYWARESKRATASLGVSRHNLQCRRQPQKAPESQGFRAIVLRVPTGPSTIH